MLILVKSPWLVICTYWYVFTKWTPSRMPWGIVAGPGVVDDHQFSASLTSLTVGGPHRQRSTKPGKSLHYHVSVKGFVKSPQRGCTEWNWKTCCLCLCSCLCLYLCPAILALLLFTCLFAYNVTDIKIPAYPFVPRGRAYVYTSAFENEITIVCGITVRVARGGYPTSPPAIGKHSLFGAGMTDARGPTENSQYPTQRDPSRFIVLPRPHSYQSS